MLSQSTRMSPHSIRASLGYWTYSVPVPIIIPGSYRFVVGLAHVSEDDEPR